MLNHFDGLTRVQRAEQTATVRHQTFTALLNGWDPDARPVTCANCLHAVVSELDDDGIPFVECERGHSQKPKWMPQMIRAKSPSVLRAAKECPDFASMSEGTP